MFAMPASFKNKPLTGTRATSTSHGIYALTVGPSNGPKHVVIYSRIILRAVTRKMHPRRRRLATWCRVRRATFEGPPPFVNLLFFLCLACFLVCDLRIVHVLTLIRASARCAGLSAHRDTHCCMARDRKPKYFIVSPFLTLPFPLSLCVSAVACMYVNISAGIA